MRPKKFSLAKGQHREDGAVVGSAFLEIACNVRIVEELGDLLLLIAAGFEGLGLADVLLAIGLAGKETNE
jgi:hypothetical protein